MKKRIITPIALLAFMVLFIALYSSCKKDNETEDEQPDVEGYTYGISQLQITTGGINEVEALFQVKNLKGEQFEPFAKTDFEITENGNDISDIVDFKNHSTLNIQHKTVILIDVSMGNALNIPDMQFALKEFINKMHPDESMAIYTFSGEINELIDFTNNKDNLKNALQYMAIGVNSRNLNQALTETLPLFTKEIDPDIKQGAIVLITGGNDNVGLTGHQQVMDTRGEKLIYTLNTMADTTTDNSSLDDLSNGLYLETYNITELAGNLIDLHDMLDLTIESYYMVSYRSSEMGDKTNELKIALTSGTNTTDPPNAVFSFNSVDFINWSENGLLINNGITEMDIPFYSSKTVTVTVLVPLETPEYYWTTSNPEVISISTDNGALNTVYAVGVLNDTATITVTDNGNNLTTSFFCEIKNETGTIQDPRDEKIYPTVKIGNYWWFAKNLDFETENSWYYDDDAQYEEFGRLYTRDAAMDACPQGWHLPSFWQWRRLESSLDSIYSYYDTEWDNYLWRGFNAGGNMKNNSGQYWAQPNIGATNYSGFNVIPAGHKSISGTYSDINERAYFWIEDSGTVGHYMMLQNNEKRIFSATTINVSRGMSVRCVKD